MNEMYSWIALILLLVGGINLGIYGIINVDIITSVLGHILGRLVDIVIGVAAGYKIYLLYMGKMKKT